MATAENTAIDLHTPVTDLGLDRRTLDGLIALGLTNVGRLIAHLPMRHAAEHAETDIAELKPDVVGSARGEVTACGLSGFGKGRRFEAVLADDSGRLDLVFFHQPYLARKLHPGMRLLVQGAPKMRGTKLQLANPTFEILKDDDHEPERKDDSLRPVYPASEQIDTRRIERAIDKIRDRALPLIEDHLSDAYRRERELPALADAYGMMHAPGSEADISLARERLVYDEFLLLQLAVHMKRAQLRQRLIAPALDASNEIDARIRARLPFELTPAQEKVTADLRRDLSENTPTNRLIQGDVGSGKTAVALYAMLLAVASGHQAALMAPTTILAEQHLASFERMLEGSKTRVALLTGSTPQPDREAILARLISGDIDILIGTHAVITGAVRFASLAVAIIDEQHRFGVQQRARLRAKADDATSTPHALVMTATPIPRTISMTLFGDLDVSTIDGMPPGRAPVETTVFDARQRAQAYELVRAAAARNEQAYIVAPAIDAEDLTSVETLRTELSENYLKDLRLATLHGRMKRDEREAVMNTFRAGEYDALIATTVIEVGVDVPNATCIVIEHAERFGLAQLHQLRGRVGRGDKPGSCALIADAPETEQTEDAKQRLAAIAATRDGFRLAEEDLRIRGMGDLFGTRQSGLAPFKLADIEADRELLEMARRDAAAWIAESPDLARPRDALAKRRMIRAHGQWLDLGDVG